MASPTDRRPAAKLPAVATAATNEQSFSFLQHRLAKRVSYLLYEENRQGAGKRISVGRLSKEIHSSIGVRRILDDISFAVGPGEKIAVLGGNGAGKSTLLRIIGGVDSETSGEIHRGLFLSWPLGFAGGLGLEMTGVDNVRFIARLYGAPTEEMVEFVDDFAELGRQLFLPVKYYSRAECRCGLHLP